MGKGRRGRRKTADEGDGGKGDGNHLEDRMTKHLSSRLIRKRRRHSFAQQRGETRPKRNTIGIYVAASGERERETERQRERERERERSIE